MVTVCYDEYYSDVRNTFMEKDFQDLHDVEEWMFSQMREDYSDKENGKFVMSFPTPEKCKEIKADGPWAIEFVPIYNGPTYRIHQIKDGNGIIFSDGKYTANRRHWSKNVQRWLAGCESRQYSPVFNFVA